MFHSARIKLTSWYLFIIMAVSMTFSAIIYRGMMVEVERFSAMQRNRIERRLLEKGLFPLDEDKSPSLPIINYPELIEETKKRVLFILFIINGGILFISGGFGYFLAGRTLRPIKMMVDEQNRFISDASHELRTPLTSLKTGFEVFLRDNNSNIKEAKVLAKESVAEVNKLQALSDALLQLARYQKTGNNVRFEKLQIREIIETSIKKISSFAQKKNIIIEKDITAVHVQGDRDSLISLMVIILDNAVKYSPDKSKISIKSEKDNGMVKIMIKDRGIGIDEKDLSHIFDRFFRADSARSRQDAGGYGLGLPIAQKIVERHNGTIQIESKIGHGTSINIRLPIKRYSDHA